MENEISYRVIGCALRVYSKLGPGLFEHAYQDVLMHELKKEGLKAESEVPIDIVYDDFVIRDAYRADIIVEDKVILELKSVDEISKLHYKQLQTYLRLTKLRVGLLLNFNTDDMMKGVRRVVNNYQ